MSDVLPTLKKLERRQQDMVLTYDDASEYTVTMPPNVPLIQFTFSGAVGMTSPLL